MLVNVSKKLVPIEDRQILNKLVCLDNNIFEENVEYYIAKKNISLYEL